MSMNPMEGRCCTPPRTNPLAPPVPKRSPVKVLQLHKPGIENPNPGDGEVLALTAEGMRSSSSVAELSPNQRMSAAARTSADIFFGYFEPSPGAHTPTQLLNTSFSSEESPLRRKCSGPIDLNLASAELRTEEVLSLLGTFSAQGRLNTYEHYTFPNPSVCKAELVNLIKKSIQRPFDPEQPERLTILTWISPSLKKGFLDEESPEHKTVFYVERTEPSTFDILSLDSIGTPTTRRLIQAIRTDLEEDPTIKIRGWTIAPIRQKTLYGCGAFSLDDLLRCHERPHFFQEILQFPRKECGLDGEIIVPPEFMISAQSFTELTSYITENALPCDKARIRRLAQEIMKWTEESPLTGRPVNRYIEHQNDHFRQLAKQRSLKSSSSDEEPLQQATALPIKTGEGLDT